MSSIVIVGSQWGDEGKGKITDFFSQKADLTARYQGGNNAGHSIIFNDQEFHLQSIPSGIFDNQKSSVIGNGVVVNPKSLISEIDYLNENGISTDNLRISNRAHVIMPYHVMLDEIQEARATNKIGTTKNGIGPTYMDKYQRIGIRIADLINPDVFYQALKNALTIKNELLTKIYEVEPIDFDQLYQEYCAYAERIKPYVTDTSYLINNALDNEQKVLFEGAQGSMLDVDHGTYPYVTSSNPCASGAATGVGIGPSRIDHVIGVCKAYTSRVGEGPFPTELNNQVSDTIRKIGHEYGVVTKRPRRIGWFDSVVLNHAARVSGFTHLSINCLDVLTGIDTLKICTAYKLDGEIINYYPADLQELERVQPIYEEFPGWQEDITQCKTLAELPINAQNYLNKISELTHLPFATFSTGPDRNQTHITSELW